MPDDKCIVDPERDCIGKAAAAKLEWRISALEENQAKEAEFRELYYKERLERAKRDAALDSEIKSINTKLDQLISWKSGEQQKPEKFLDGLKNNAWWAIIAAVLGYVLGQLGL